ncbi:tryptophan halogenase family protein [Stappia sp.]|uniref:tryptophan halogenase family protein n=1 Tax=Stappia sp. TaxID=1870903 RepID=UPI0032D8C581
MHARVDIAIIGGGATGWMAAAYLNRFLPSLDIAVMESPDVPPLGVGESLNSVSRRFNAALGIDEAEFLRAVDGTYKIGIAFEEFADLGTGFFHPFGRPAGPVDAHPHAQDAFPATWLCRANRFDPGQGARGYHVCATRYAGFLRDLATARGVTRIAAHAERVRRSGRAIAAVEDLEADLFIDCTGFRGLLLGDALQTPFHGLDDTLPNDAAVALRVPYERIATRPFPFTRCAAQEAGWIWEIPLWSRLGAGYCYARRHLTPDDATARLKAHLGLSADDDLEPMHIRFRHGRHARAVAENCVALGGAFGFIEPLESTGLAMTQANIMSLVPGLADLGRWDRLCRERFDTTADFVFAHYRLSRRRDSAYWREIQTRAPGPRLARLLAEARHGDFERIDNDPGHFYRARNWNAVLSGMGLFDAPETDAPPLDTQDLAARAAEAPDFVTHLAETLHGPPPWPHTPPPSPVAPPAPARRRPAPAPMMDNASP